MTRMLVIGASGLDWGGFDRLTRSGALPNLGRMRQKGAAGWLTGAPAVIGPAPFATMVAGQQPEVHGLWRAREAWAGGVRPLSRASWRAPPAWAYLEAAGIRTATVAWPGNRPGDSGPGSHIDEDFAEPSSHDPADWALPLHCAPVGLRTALRARQSTTQPSHCAYGPAAKTAGNQPANLFQNVVRQRPDLELGGAGRPRVQPSGQRLNVRIESVNGGLIMELQRMGPKAQRPKESHGRIVAGDGRKAPQAIGVFRREVGGEIRQRTTDSTATVVGQDVDENRKPGGLGPALPEYGRGPGHDAALLCDQEFH